MTMQHRRLVAVGLALAGALLAPAAASPTPAVASGAPLPACRYDDVLTAPRAYADWAETLVDTILMVPKSYVPPDLVAVSGAGIPGSGSLRAVVIDDLAAMTTAAAAAGASLAIQSAYRSYADQEATFQHWVDVNGYQAALTVSARPGHSEHQLGVGVDFKTAGAGAPWNVTDWATTTEGAWLAAHGWEYGFVMSYPKGRTAISCYSYEPWHYRYVGRDLAAKIHASGLVPRQYLWEHFVTATVPAPSGAPLPTPAPTPAATPSEPTPRPSAAPSPAPSAGAPSAEPTPDRSGAAPTPRASDEPAPADDPTTSSASLVSLAALAVVVTVVLAGLRIGRPRGGGRSRGGAR